MPCHNSAAEEYDEYATAGNSSWKNLTFLVMLADTDIHDFMDGSFLLAPMLDK